MPGDPVTHTSEEEINELREQLRQVREEQERQRQVIHPAPPPQNGTPQPDKTPHQNVVSSTWHLNGGTNAPPGGAAQTVPASEQTHQTPNAQQSPSAQQVGNGQPAATKEPLPPAGNVPPAGQERAYKPKKRHRLRKYIIIGAVLVVAIIAFIWWLNSRNYESTDDATVDSHMSGLSARIAGTIIAVYADENQRVRAGQVLVDLDPRDDQVAVRQAQGRLAEAESQTTAQQPNVPVTQVTSQTNVTTANAAVAAAQAAVASAEQTYQSALAKVNQAEATNAKNQADVARYRPLVEKDEVPREQYDQVVATAQASAAAVSASQADARAASQQVNQSREQLREAQDRARAAVRNLPNEVAIQKANVATRQAAVQAAQANLQQAQLNLSYAKIITPVDGIVAKRLAELGQHVAPGQEVFLIAEVNNMWVTANFKETQLRRMRPGQSVQIHVDALGKDFIGYVESMPAASGSVTALLPPENATGNYVKVVQRLPVRILFNKNQSGLDLLRPGMSVEPKVNVG